MQNQNEEILEYSNPLFTRQTPAAIMLIKKKQVVKPKPEDSKLMNKRFNILQREILDRQIRIDFYEKNIAFVEMANKDIRQFLNNSKIQLKDRLKQMILLSLKLFCNPEKSIVQNIFALILQNKPLIENNKDQTCIFFKDIVINVDFLRKLVNSFGKKVFLGQPFIWKMINISMNNTIESLTDFSSISEFKNLSSLYEKRLLTGLLYDHKKLSFKIEEILGCIYEIYVDIKKNNNHYNPPSFTNLYPKFIKHDEKGNRVYDMGNVSLHNGYASNNIFTETHSFNTFKMLFED